MVSAVKAPDILRRIKRSDGEFEEMMRQVDRFGSKIHILKIVERGAEAAYNAGYLAGYQAAQGNMREAIGIPERE